MKIENVKISDPKPLARLQTKNSPKKVIAQPIAYVIKDKAFGEFEVLNSSNGWWLEKRKVEDLISAFKMGCTDAEAWANAGISKAQWDYFVQLHKNFSDVKAALKQLPRLKARKTINDSLGEIQGAQWYAERKMNDEFSTRHQLVGGEADSEPIKIQVVKPN